MYEVPVDLEAVFRKMMAKQVEDRYQSMTQVVADLQRCELLASPTSSATINNSSSSATEESDITLALGSRRLQAIPAVERYVEPAKQPVRGYAARL